MKVLKGFGLSILGFLLFLSLSIFGIAFLLNSTLLNPDFVTDEVDKIDVSALAKELFEEEISEQLPEELPFLQEAIYDAIDEQEPWLKEQANIAIYAAYDFFLGKDDRLEISIPLETLKENYKESLWETFNENLPMWIPDLVEYGLIPYITEYLPEFGGLSEEQLRLYLEQYLEEISEQIASEGLSPEISEFLEEMIKPYFDHYYDEIAAQIPSEYIIDESSIPSEVMEQMVLAREYLGYFQTGYYALIGFMLLLILSIILIYRNVRDSTRDLGITFLAYGVLEFTAVYLVRNYIALKLPFHDLPSSLQVWTLGLFRDLWSPLQWFSLGVLIGGAILLAVSFVYKPRVTED